VDAGLVTMTAFISPYREDRAQARAIVGEAFIEVHVDCDVAVCESRDPKGLYKKARSGAIKDFTGISAPYEAPETPELRIDTSAAPLEVCVAQVVDYLVARKLVP
jgi:adenylylsulfate kinase